MKRAGISLEKLKQRNSYYTLKEIFQQSKTWMQSLYDIENQACEIKEFLKKFNNKETRIILTGAGSSAFAGQVIGPYLNKRLKKSVECIATTDIVLNPLEYLYEDTETIMVSFARSGNSPESIAAVSIAEKVVKNLNQLIITCNENGNLYKRFENSDKDLIVLMPQQCNDIGFAMTSSFTTMLLTAIGIFDINNIDNIMDSIKCCINSNEKFIEDNINYIKNIAMKDFERIVYIGTGVLKGIARESGLKMLELTNGKVNSSYDTALGFRHGPKSVINDKTVTVFYISKDKYKRKYEIDLLKEMHSENKENIIIAVGEELNELEGFCDYSLNFNTLIEDNYTDIIQPLQYIIVGQLLAFYKSWNLGITVDNPCPSGVVNRVVKGVNIYEFDFKK
ncbi:SIS domain-containing protein [Clostridium senegalense]|uniref:SIS domain-containing protein n=1 Tax=Clostridium senegalense TaxID=1465809 RepID=A0A6M0H7G4_9CLOT|nr:SIS domain-containing protein [Clostridium senegalense]NEU05973.1 SIS domain-containing protein [Clostridium senegalense]